MKKLIKFIIFIAVIVLIVTGVIWFLKGGVEDVKNDNYTKIEVLENDTPIVSEEALGNQEFNTLEEKKELYEIIKREFKRKIDNKESVSITSVTETNIDGEIQKHLHKKIYIKDNFYGEMYKQNRTIYAFGADEPFSPANIYKMYFNDKNFYYQGRLYISNDISKYSFDPLSAGYRVSDKNNDFYASIKDNLDSSYNSIFGIKMNNSNPVKPWDFYAEKVESKLFIYAFKEEYRYTLAEIEGSKITFGFGMNGTDDPKVLNFNPKNDFDEFKLNARYINFTKEISEESAQKKYEELLDEQQHNISSIECEYEKQYSKNGTLVEAKLDISDLNAINLDFSLSINRNNFEETEIEISTLIWDRLTLDSFDMIETANGKEYTYFQETVNKTFLKFNSEDILSCGICRASNYKIKIYEGKALADYRAECSLDFVLDYYKTKISGSIKIIETNLQKDPRYTSYEIDREVILTLHSYRYKDYYDNIYELSKPQIETVLLKSSTYNTYDEFFN